MTNKNKNDENATFKLSDFFTADLAEEGKRINLVTPSGADSGHWLEVMGVDSKAYRRANTKMQRSLANNVITFKEDFEGLDDANDLTVTETVARVVKAWSFDEPCTHANVVNFFKSAPQIQDQVDLYINNRKRFFA